MKDKKSKEQEAHVELDEDKQMIMEVVEKVEQEDKDRLEAEMRKKEETRQFMEDFQKTQLKLKEETKRKAHKFNKVHLLTKPHLF